MIDTQLHLVDPRYPFAAGGYHPRPHEMGALPALLAAMDRCGLTHGVLVQPSAYGTDNTALLDALERHPERLRGVVMTDDPARFARIPGVVGVRLNLVDYRPHGAAGRQMVRAVLGEGLILQLQATPDTLLSLLEDAPDGPVVIDHMGRPASAQDARRVAALAERAQTFLKISGGFRITDAWPTPGPALTDLARSFAAATLWGSDWPFLNTPLRPSIEETLAWGDALADLRAASRTAARLFGFPLAARGTSG